MMVSRQSFYLAAWAGLVLTLSGCSSTPTPKSGDPAALYPYLPGQNYTWVDAASQRTGYPDGQGQPWKGIRAQGLGSTDSDLSDLSWTSASSGYGPIELNKSNNTSAGGDGQTLTIGSATFAKGLGVHANSQIVYALDGACTVFKAQVGVDAEVGSRGSIVFQVWDGTSRLLYDSGVRRGGMQAAPVNVSVSGVQNLRLVVTDAGDGISYDHADWGNAAVTCSAAQPSGETFLSNLTPTAATNGYGPYELRTSNGERPAGDGHKITIAGSTFNDGLGVHAGSQLIYLLGGQCSAFSASLGVDDEVLYKGKGSVTFQVLGDDTLLYDSGKMVSGDPARAVNLNVAGKQRLTLRVGDAGDGVAYDHADWADAKVTCTAVQPSPESAFINFQPSSSALPSGYKADTGAAYNDIRGYGWITQASVGSPAGQPLEISLNSRDRTVAGIDQRLNTLMHMQFPFVASNGVNTPAAWQYKLPNGSYTVTVGVGDASNAFDSVHQINIEGNLAIPAFTPSLTSKFSEATLRVSVTDGFLTVDATGGSNTKLDFVLIQPGDQPSIRSYLPRNSQTLIATTAPVTADVNLLGSAIDLSSLSASSVRLINVATGVQIPATINTSGGGDAVVLQPSAPLAANTQYRFEVNGNLKDLSGKSFLPMTSSFVTGNSSAASALAFEKLAQSAVPARPYTSVEMGPDSKLYAATLTGEILRFGVQPDGTLSAPQTISTVQTANGGPRTIIGLKFDPASTADNLILWISNGAFWNGTDNAPDWSGKISRLSGPNLENYQDYVVGLPRSIRDHQTNSVAFRPAEPNALYVLQGSNSAMGAPDAAWGNRPERLLNGALLKINLSQITAPPLNVQTEQGGSYNPYAPGAALTIYASGIRNAYDMVWHTNGQLYVPTNGSAAGGNTPGTPASLPASCQTKVGGPYTAPSVPALTNVGTQNDFLFRVVAGGYYGHPNPLRCEWVLNGGNPAAGADPAEVAEYPIGTLPDPNYRGFAYDFGQHASANGVIEEYTSAPISALRNKLLVVRYSGGKDIIVLSPGGANGDIVQAQTGITGLTNFNPSPLDITEDRTNGHLYVAQLDELTGSGTITLVRLK